MSTRKSSAYVPVNEPTASIPASASVPASSCIYTTRSGRKVSFLLPLKYRPSDMGHCRGAVRTILCYSLINLRYYYCDIVLELLNCLICIFSCSLLIFFYDMATVFCH
ncbi:hypothetical protein AVEN_157851-1 [Araneus ventricosus]|uniref:Uncharacterized protein n=1 Tax=Araneus ventricosus TaxID=182803 RepID=A0A4Y2E633_ARAVE|nr:hypothetical protein AVEN_157851-1 [Araneus ventricosus]